MDENYRLHFPIMETPILHVFHSLHEVRQGSQQSSLRQEDDLCRHETKFFFFQIAHQLPPVNQHVLSPPTYVKVQD